MVSECQRVANGLPIFEAAETGHATHMYGPLTNVIVGGVFRLAGPSLYPGRLLSVASLALGLILLIRLTRPKGQWLGAFMVVAMFVAFGQAANWYVEIRPDCTSAFAALVAVWMMFESHRRDSLKWLFAASVACVVALLFRQPAAMVTGIPACAMLVSREKFTQPRRLAFCLLPLGICLAVLGLIRTQFPQVFHYLVAVPSTYPISIPECFGWFLWFAVVTTGFWLALFWTRHLRQNGPLTFESKSAWLIAAVLVTLPCCVVTAAKEGGTSNSLLPALFAVAGLFLHWSEPLQRWLKESVETKDTATSRTSGPKSRFASGTILATCVLLPMFVISVHSPQGTFGDRGFEAIQKFADENPSATFASPYDPALVVLARGNPGRSIMLEYDAAGWPTDVPRWFFSDLDAADYAVTVAGWRAWPLAAESVEDMMQQRGFHRVMLPTLADSAYRLWSRAD